MADLRTRSDGERVASQDGRQDDAEGKAPSSDDSAGDRPESETRGGPSSDAADSRADQKGGRANKPNDSRDRAESGNDAGEKDEAKTNVVRRHPVWFGLGAVAVIAIAVAGYVYWLTFVHPYETTDDAFVDARQFTIAPKVGGYVVDVAVTDNQHVEAGAVLMQIDKRDYQIAVEQSESQIASAEASIENVDAQVEAQKAQIEVAKAQVETAQAALTFAQEDAARYRDLAQRGAGTVQRSQQSSSDLQQRQAAVSSANAGVIAARKQVGALQAQRASAEASLAQAKAQRDQARLNLGYTTVTAAQAGRVVQLTGAKGEYAQAGQSLSMFVPDEKWVIANYKETQITDMRPGQHVDVEIDAYPDRKITGRIDSVQPGSGTAFSLLPAQNATGNYVKVTQRIPVKIVVDDWPEDVSIGPGMSIVPKAHVR